MTPQNPDFHFSDNRASNVRLALYCDNGKAGTSTCRPPERMVIVTNIVMRPRFAHWSCAKGVP